VAAAIPCLLCGTKLEMRIDKNQKPYFVCDPCGIQMFIRRKKGIELLQRFCRYCDVLDNPFRKHSESFLKIQALIGEIEDCKARIQKFDDEISFFFPDNELVRARNALANRVQVLTSDLEQLSSSSYAERN